MSGGDFIHVGGFLNERRCVDCGKVMLQEPSMEEMSECSRCHGLLCIPCRLVDEITGGTICFSHCFSSMLSRDEAKILIALLHRMQPYSIRRFMNISDERFETALQILIDKGLVREQVIGPGWKLKLTDDGLPMAATALKAYSKMADIAAMIKKMEAGRIAA